MATYVNDLRLTEITTGDEAGDWGDITNTNLELIAEAFSFGTEAITTNADTHTTTIADGSTDPGRSMFLKYTGTLDSACTITIGPNTVSKLWFIENGTSGSQNIIISSGSGANITIPPGDTKVIYSDGGGSGAAMVDAFASLSVVDLKVQDDLTVTDDLIVNGDIDLEGSIDVNGTANLDVVDIDGAVDMATTLTLAGNADFNGDLDVDGTTNLDVVDIDGAVDMATTLAVAGNVDFNGDLDVDGTTNLDVVDIDGAVDMATTLSVTGNVTLGGQLIMPDVTSTKMLVADGTSYQEVSISGDVTIANTGAVTIAANAVEGSMLNNNVISGQTALTSGLATDDELLVSDGGTLKRMDVSVLTTLTDDNATALAIALG
jgi:cytoskeletal protein CcmA (bactofilin family)